MKKITKIFLLTIIIEIIFVVASSFLPSVNYPSPCTTPDFFHPFGRITSSEEVCSHMLSFGPNPLFYLSQYLLIFTLILFVIYLLINKFKKKNR